MGKFKVTVREGETEREAYERTLADFIVRYPYGCEDGKEQFLASLGIRMPGHRPKVTLKVELTMPETAHRQGPSSVVYVPRNGLTSPHLYTGNDVLDIPSIVYVALRESPLIVTTELNPNLVQQTDSSI